MHKNRATRQFSFLVLCVAATLLFCLKMNAQVQNRAEDRTRQLKEMLQLTDQQTIQVRAIMVKLDKQSNQTKAKRKGNRYAIRREVRKHISAADREIEKILTPEQLERFKVFKKVRRDEFRGWRKGKGSEYNF
jgi:hypothetical protein